MDMDELKITLTMLDIDWQHYWRLNHNNGDIMFNIDKEKPDIKLFILDLLKNNNFKYKFQEYLINDTEIIIYNKR